MKILYVASEAAPFAKTGGLADVAGALPAALADMGHDVRLAMPGYSSINREKYHIESLLPEIVVHFPEGAQTGRVSTCIFPGSSVPVYFIEHDDYFGREGLYQDHGVDYPDNAERFAFFCQGVLWTLTALEWQPDIICCNDWQTAFIPIYLRAVPQFADSLFFRPSKLLFTIHNLAFQGLASATWIPRLGLPLETFTIDRLEFYGKMNLLKGGIVFSDKISTVSPRYAEEIQTEEFGCGLEGVLRKRKADVVGILNGIDVAQWSPDVDEFIPQKFSLKDMSGKAVCKEHLQRNSKLEPDADAPLIGVISRMTDQKGFDLMADAMRSIMELGAQFVLLGTGDVKYHHLFERFEDAYPWRVSIHLKFDNRLAHEIEAGADMFLMPSRFEPCGLNQMYSLRYGTIPIVRRVGGLADSIVDYTEQTARDCTGTGFVFQRYTVHAMLEAIRRAVKVYRTPEEWRQLQHNAMRQDFSWSVAAKHYVQLFQDMLEPAEADEAR